jgi:pimeloyl-ACP methyl ester carboxylesterase
VSVDPGSGRSSVRRNRRTERRLVMTNSEDGTPIAVTRVGEGPAVVCVGGALNDRNSTAGVAARLADRFTVYSYDRRGRGDSGDTQPYAPEREFEDLASVVAAAGGTAMVYGMSSGAVLALRAAAAGVPITRLALYEPPLTSAVPDAPGGPADYTDRLTTLVRGGRFGAALELFMVDVIGMPALVVNQMRETPMWPALEKLTPSLRYDDLVLGDRTIPATVPIPVTVMAGTASPDWARAVCRVVADAMPAGELRELPDQTHNVNPYVLADALAEIFA